MDLHIFKEKSKTALQQSLTQQWLLNFISSGFFSNNKIKLESFHLIHTIYIFYLEKTKVVLFYLVLDWSKFEKISAFRSRGILIRLSEKLESRYTQISLMKTCPWYIIFNAYEYLSDSNFDSRLKLKLKFPCR